MFERANGHGSEPHVGAQDEVAASSWGANCVSAAFVKEGMKGVAAFPYYTRLRAYCMKLRNL